MQYFRYARVSTIQQSLVYINILKQTAVQFPNKELNHKT